MTTATKFSGNNYSIELIDGQFVLEHPVSENQVFDSFDELVEAHPVCEESRKFFFGEQTALDFANSIKDACLFIVSVGSPAGRTIAILPECSLPVDLEELTGEVVDGVFSATNLTSGSGLRDWNFTDIDGSTIQKVQLFSDESTWQAEYAEWFGE
jgi:hypothetical protein